MTLSIDQLNHFLADVDNGLEHSSNEFYKMEVVNEPSARATRIFNPEEMEGLSKECRGLIIKLEQLGVLTPHAREFIIAHMLEFNAGESELEPLKWLSMIALSDQLDDVTITQVLDYLLLKTQEA
jgi:uncharacterized protein Smg (DUF494 family)